jgi:hypothetical protein
VRNYIIKYGGQIFLNSNIYLKCTINLYITIINFEMNGVN